MIKYKINGFCFIRTVLNRMNSKKVNDIINSSDYSYIVSYENYDKLKWYKKEIKKTPVINLISDIDSVFNQFNSTTRNEVNKTFKIKQLKFYGPIKGNDKIYEIHRFFETSQGRTPWINNEIINCNNFVAFYDGIPIAFIGFTINDNILRVIHINSLRTNEKKLPCEKKIIPWSTRRILYEACKYGFDKSLKKVDLGVVNLSDSSKEGVARFKMSFTKNIVKTYIFRYASKDVINFIKQLRKDQNLYIH